MERLASGQFGAEDLTVLGGRSRLLTLKLVKLSYKCSWFYSVLDFEGEA